MGGLVRTRGRPRVPIRMYVYIRTYVWGPLGGLSQEAKFKQDVKPRSDCSVRTEWVV
jgi:hypothetical protein